MRSSHCSRLAVSHCMTRRVSCYGRAAFRGMLTCTSLLRSRSSLAFRKPVLMWFEELVPRGATIPRSLATILCWDTEISSFGLAYASGTNNHGSCCEHVACVVSFYQSEPTHDCYGLT